MKMIDEMMMMMMMVRWRCLPGSRRDGREKGKEMGNAEFK